MIANRQHAKFGPLFALAWLLSSVALANEASIGICTDSEYQPSKASALNNEVERTDYRSTRMVNRVTAEDVVIDVRSELDVGQIRLKNTLAMPLYSIKSKHYLKSERLLLVASGVNYAELQAEVAKLERLRFKHVRILRNGILALDRTSYLSLSDKQRFESQLIDANDAVAAAIEQPHDLVFINLAKTNNALNLLGLEYSENPNATQAQKQQWAAQILSNLADSSPAKTVIIIGDSLQQYRELRASSAIFSGEHVRFTIGGIASFDKVHQSLLSKIDLLENPKRKCQS